jgi:ATP-dependent protease ClpP protease subunit
MKTLNIEGVISRKVDAEKLAPGEKSFSLDDLENFLALNGAEPFEVVIKSPGGSVEEGFKIYDRLKGLDVTTVALTANSIASVIFLAGKVRKVTPTSQLIIHNAWVDAEELAGEKLNFHTLKALTDMFAETDLKILNVYTAVAGSENTAKLFALMAEDTNLGADLALNLGFATELADAEYKALSFKSRVLTFSKNQLDLIDNQIENEMKTEEKLNAFEKALAGLKNLFKVQLKNMAVVTKEGVAIFIAGAEDGELVGKTVYLAEEGLPTETLAPAGDHTLEDGTTVTLDANGVITEVEAPEPVEDVEALRAAYEKEKMAMEEEKEKLAAQVAAQAKTIEESQAKFNQLVKDFADLKNLVVGDPDDKKKKAEKQLSNEEFAKLPYSEKIRLRAMAKAEA